MPQEASPEHALRAASWQRVREDFERLAALRSMIPLVAVVTDGDADPSAFIRELAARDNGVHWQGTLIRPANDQPGAYEPVPAPYRLFAFGEPETWESFRAAAMRAGVLAQAVPDSVLPASVRERTSDDLARWAWTLFEVGWRKLDCVPFRAERWVRDDRGGAIQLELARTAGLYRGWYWSEIGDAVSATIDVLDVIRTLERANESVDDKKAASELKMSDPGTLKGRSAAEARKPRAKRGRKPNTDAKEDKRIAEAWLTKQHRTFADLERAWNLPAGTAKRAVDRHRKRQARRK